MSRLREAFEKAGRRQAGRAIRNSAAAQGADPAVPRDWDFDLNPGESSRGPAPPCQVRGGRTARAGRSSRIGPTRRGADRGRARPPHRRAGPCHRPTAAAGRFLVDLPVRPKGIGKVVVGPGAESTLVEQYRRLGAALHHHQFQSGARTLMVTSAVAAEGKTLTATNLALTLSHSYQRRVLLVDADLRRPSIHDILRLPEHDGVERQPSSSRKRQACAFTPSRRTYAR